MGVVALDLFAGTGWGVACQRLGIEEYGIEIMPEAVAPRDANGMRTILRDVWDGLEGDSPLPAYDTLIASPPCQTFSIAGHGAGRQALNVVLELLRSGAYRDPVHLRAFGESHDPRTALVLTPMAYVARDLPRFVVFEQVSPVRYVWEACALELEQLGYSTWTGILNAEQYGVPQTRRRALLIARRDGIPAAPPAPTHSRYYSTAPSRLDPDVLPWRSMADAIGWGMTERPMVTVAPGTEGGGPDTFAAGGSHARKIITDARATGRWLQSQYSTGGDYSSPGRREITEPAPTVTSRADRNRWRNGSGSGREMNTDRVSAHEAALLQSYPPEFVFVGTKTKQFLQIGNAVPPALAEAVLRLAIPDPVPTGLADHMVDIVRAEL